MEAFSYWLGFIGAWCLFAGPIYQAALELKDEDIEIDRIRAAGSKIPRQPRVSNWWWLLPPVKFYKEFQRGRTSRIAIVKVLSKEDVEAMISFNSKASAWLLVALGGFCIASKETFELVHHEEWSIVALFALVVGMFGLSILHLVYRLRRAEAWRSL